MISKIWVIRLKYIEYKQISNVNLMATEKKYQDSFMADETR